MDTVFIAAPKSEEFLELGTLIDKADDKARILVDMKSAGRTLVEQSALDPRPFHYRFKVRYEDGDNLDFSGLVTKLIPSHTKSEAIATVSL